MGWVGVTVLGELGLEVVSGVEDHMVVVVVCCGGGGGVLWCGCAGRSICI